MKKILSIAIILFGMLQVYAQAPEKMSYQAIIRNSSGALLQNQNIAVKVSVLQNSASGAAVYSERIIGTTNTNGLLSMEIGSGTVLSGAFSSINWSSGNYYLKTETDPTGGTNYTIAGTSQLLSVPYAMYAKTSGSGNTLTLPYSGISNTNNVIPFKITNSNGTLNQAGYFENTNPSNSAPAVSGINKSVGGFGTGVEGTAEANTNGYLSSGVRGYVLGEGNFGAGVYGSSENARGVYGQTTKGSGVYGYSLETGTAGVFQAGNSGKALETYGKVKLGNNGEGLGKILTSDATGNATWKSPAAMLFPIKIITDNDYTATDDDYTIKFVATSNKNINKTITLPTPVGKTGRIYKIYAKIPQFGTSETGSYSVLYLYDANGVNILANELEISAMMNRWNRFQSQYLDEYIKFSSVTVQSDGTAWRVIEENSRYSRDYWEAP